MERTRAFREGRLPDLPVILDILTEAAKWAKDRGVQNFWPVPFPAELVRRDLDRREVVLCEVSEGVVGTMTLMKTDPDTWGPRSDLAGYVHRIAVRRRPEYLRLGAALLDEASDRIRRWGGASLRLDTLATNERLVRYYESIGFIQVGTARPAHAEHRLLILFERKIDRVEERP
jgi:ribosomal protein S18 acetylase RimI-like enzyme